MTDSAASAPDSTAPHADTRTPLGGDDELLSRVRVIEQQPLAARADAFAALHDELAARLESGPQA